MDEIILIDKPKGITSFDVIRHLRKKLDIRKMGHAGTLDPLASGLMIIGVGKGTKKLADLIKLDKTYEAKIILGEKRTTGDLEGDIIEEKDVENIDEEQVKKVLEEMIGTLELNVPIYSAIKRGGESLYKKARRGEKVEAPIKVMTIHSAKLEKIEQVDNRVHVFVTFDVGSGTYIRSLAEEFGKRLGYPATLGGLRRTVIGEFDIRDAVEV